MDNEDGWRRATEQLFRVLAFPQEGRTKLDACMAYLEVSTPEAFDEHPREYQAVAAAAFEDGATWEQVARAATMNMAEAQRRWGTVGPPPVPGKRRPWYRWKQEAGGAQGN